MKKTSGVPSLEGISTSETKKLDCKASCLFIRGENMQSHFCIIHTLTAHNYFMNKNLIAD